MSDSVLHILEQLQDAAGNRERARILLRVPDAIMIAYGGHFGEECRRRTFEAGWEFCTIRWALMSAVRDEHGLLPETPARELEQWRVALSRFAAGETVEGLTA